MKKIYKLNAPIYGKSDYICVSCKYDKKAGGYVACIEALEKNVIDNTVLWGKVFCKEYYQSGGDGIVLIASSGRRSAKKESEAWKIISEKAADYVEKFLVTKGKSELTFIEEII